MDPENAATEDFNHAEEGSPADDSEMVRNASYWEQIDQDEVERVRRYDNFSRLIVSNGYKITISLDSRILPIEH